MRLLCPARRPGRHVVARPLARPPRRRPPCPPCPPALACPPAHVPVSSRPLSPREPRIKKLGGGAGAPAARDAGFLDSCRNPHLNLAAAYTKRMHRAHQPFTGKGSRTQAADPDDASCVNALRHSFATPQEAPMFSDASLQIERKRPSGVHVAHHFIRLRMSVERSTRYLVCVPTHSPPFSGLELKSLRLGPP